MYWTVVILCVLATHVNGQNKFVTTAVPGPTNNLRLRESSRCENLGSTYMVYLYVFEIDITYDSNGDRIDFDCILVDQEEAASNSQLVVVSDTSGCMSTSTSFVRVRSTVSPVTDPINDRNHRSMYHTLGPITKQTAGAGSTLCGGQDDGAAAGNLLFTAFCYRENNRNHAFDRVFHFIVDVDDCPLVTHPTGALTILDPPRTGLYRNYDVSFKLYTATQASGRTEFESDEEMPAVNMIGATVALGTPLIAEICIAIEDNTLLYFADGFSVLGVFVHSCTAEPDTTGTPIFGSGTAPVNIVGASGCGEGNSPHLQWQGTEQEFRYVDPTGSPTNRVLSSPNCFRSSPFEAVSFMRNNIASPLTTILTCSLSYCRSTTESSCFEDLNTGAVNTCGIGRKRRQAENSTDSGLDGLPKTVEFRYTVLPEIEVDPYANVVNGRDYEYKNNCFEKPTFITLSVALASLIVIVLCVDVFLALRMRMNVPKDSSQNSASGFANKAFS